MQGRNHRVGYLANIFATNAIPNGVWSHVAVVYDNSILSVYLNGTLQGSTNWGSDFIMNTAFSSKIGAEGSYYFNGAIDDTMIFQRALSPSQVQTLYQSANQSLTISHLQGTLDFAKTNTDICTIKGAFALPANYNFSWQGHDLKHRRRADDLHPRAASGAASAV